MTSFRPCIDLHEGKVKQIVGGTLSSAPDALVTNFISDRPAAWYAETYKTDGLTGGHIIQLGPGNQAAAESALAAWPGGMQIGGGISPENALSFIEKGASHVIITSWLIPELRLDWGRLWELSSAVGRERVVVDISCRKVSNTWFIAKDRWQTITKEEVSPTLITRLQEFCSELLIHAADVEGRCSGIDRDLVRHLGNIVEIPATYAGGASTLSDLALVEELSRGKLDLTIGSALDIFGGTGVKYRDCVAYNQKRRHAPKKQIR